MHHRYFFVSLSLLALLNSCNIYGPFAANTSDAELIEAAQGCLHSNDIDCAIEYYNQISDTNTKNEKLCLAYISKAGLTLSSFLSIATSGTGSATLMKTVADGTMPWTQDKETAGENAVSTCTTYYNDTSGTQTAQLLNLMAALVDCGVRMGKTDLYQAPVANSGESSCSATDTNSASDGDVDPDDIGTDAGAAPGMCSYDVAKCQTNLSAVTVTDIGAIDDLYTNLPAELKAAAADAATRAAIRDLVE